MIKKNQWFDYDLIGAYPTGKTELVLLGYYKAGLIEHYELNKLSDEQFLTNYLIVNTDLKFNTIVKYTSISGYIDKTTTVLLGKVLLS